MADLPPPTGGLRRVAELRDDRGPAAAAVYVAARRRQSCVYEFSFKEIRERPVSVGVVAIN
jgi:hypothetical protein